MTELDRLEKQLQKATSFLEEVEQMDKCHVVTHPFKSVSKRVSTEKVEFEKNNGESGFCHGLDAAGDWTIGFELVKRGMLENAKAHKQNVMESIADCGHSIIFYRENGKLIKVKELENSSVGKYLLSAPSHYNAMDPLLWCMVNLERNDERE